MGRVFGVGENITRELFTFGDGLKEDGPISRIFLQFAYIWVLSERRLESGTFAIYFSATSFWTMK